MPRTMKAAVVREFRQPLAIEEVSIPNPGPGQILVKVDPRGRSRRHHLQRGARARHTAGRQEVTRAGAQSAFAPRLEQRPGACHRRGIQTLREPVDEVTQRREILGAGILALA